MSHNLSILQNLHRKTIVFICDHVQIEHAQNVHGEVNMAARNDLSLKCKVEVIEYAKNNLSQSSRKIAEVFNCERTQIQAIITKKAIKYEANAPASWKRHRRTEFSDINEAMYKWYCLARQRNVPVSLKKKHLIVLAVQMHMGHHQFKLLAGELRQSLVLCCDIKC